MARAANLARGQADQMDLPNASHGLNFCNLPFPIGLLIFLSNTAIAFLAQCSFGLCNLQKPGI